MMKQEYLRKQAENLENHRKPSKIGPKTVGARHGESGSQHPVAEDHLALAQQDVQEALLRLRGRNPPGGRLFTPSNGIEIDQTSLDFHGFERF